MFLALRFLQLDLTAFCVVDTVATPIVSACRLLVRFAYISSKNVVTFSRFTDQHGGILSMNRRPIMNYLPIEVQDENVPWHL